jgi:hypothetical protein
MSPYTEPVTLAYAHQAIRLRELAPLDEADYARATGAPLETARTWLRGEHSPSGEHADRLVELAVIVQRLSGVLKPEAIPESLNSAVPVLDDDTPLERIARGDSDAVARVVSGFESPGFS